ncbi:MAG: hypothetical protein ACRCUS_07685 [Anaerovoracaceae bacterium]
MNYENGYIGLGAEYYVSSLFYRLGYEASKLSIDFGFDLSFSNCLKEHTKNSTDFIHYLIQVKSRQVEYEEKSIHTGNFDRPSVDVEFTITDLNFLQLLNTPKAILICCIYAAGELTPSCTFWLSSAHLNFLKENKYIVKQDNIWQFVIHHRMPSCRNKAFAKVIDKCTEKYSDDREIHRLVDLFSDSKIYYSEPHNYIKFRKNSNINQRKSNLVTPAILYIKNILDKETFNNAALLFIT